MFVLQDSTALQTIKFGITPKIMATASLRQTLILRSEAACTERHQKSFGCGVATALHGRSSALRRNALLITELGENRALHFVELS